jgi:maltose alpha-D-glucosyltransferase/alpha-amylase
MGDNIGLPDRNGVRTPMQWTSARNAGFSDAAPEQLYSPVIDTPPYDPAHVNVEDQRADQNSLFHFTRRMIAINKAHLAFGEGDFRWADCENTAVAAYFRTYEANTPAERILVINNLSGKDQDARIQMPAFGRSSMTDLIHGQLLTPEADGTLQLHLKPYAYLWLHVDA